MRKVTFSLLEYRNLILILACSYEFYRQEFVVDDYDSNSNGGCTSRKRRFGEREIYEEEFIHYKHKNTELNLNGM